MGSKQKPAKKHNNNAPSEVFVSKSSEPLWSELVHKWRALGRRTQTVATVVVLVVLIAIVLLATHHSNPASKTPLPPNVDNDYSATELSNYPLLLQHDYGLTENDIMHGNLKKELKTFDEAHNIAIAIARLGNRPRSLDAYKIAVSKAPKDTDQSFYIEVMGVSYQLGDPKYGDQMYQKAVDSINNSKISATDKTYQLAHLKGLYQFTKEGEK